MENTDLRQYVISEFSFTITYARLTNYNVEDFYLKYTLVKY